MTGPGRKAERQALLALVIVGGCALLLLLYGYR